MPGESIGGVVADVLEHGWTTRDWLVGASARIADQVDELLARPDARATDAEVRVLDAGRYSSTLAEIESADWVGDFGRAAYRRRAAAWFSMANRVESGRDAPGSGGGWHRDSLFAPEFKALVYLDDVDADRGPFQFLRGSHSPAAIRSTVARTQGHGYVSRYPDIAAFEAMGYRRRAVHGPAGTIVFFDARLIHRGMPVVEGHRRALTIYYRLDGFLDREKLSLEPAFGLCLPWDAAAFELGLEAMARRYRALAPLRRPPPDEIVLAIQGRDPRLRLRLDGTATWVATETPDRTLTPGELTYLITYDHGPLVLAREQRWLERCPQRLRAWLRGALAVFNGWRP